MSSATIEIYTDNGRKIEFSISEEAALEKIAEQIRSPRFFGQKSIIFASADCVANLQGPTVEMIRVKTPDETAVEPYEGSVDIVEITRQTFESEFSAMSAEDRVAARGANPGDLITTYLEIHTEGGQTVYLRLHVPKKDSREGRMFFTHLFDRPMAEFRLEDGGFGVLRPTKYTSVIAYPGPGDDVLPENTLRVD